MAIKWIAIWFALTATAANEGSQAAPPPNATVFIDMVARDQSDPTIRCLATVPSELWDGLIRYDRHGLGGPELRWDCVLSTAEGIKAAPFLGKYDEATQAWELDFSDYDAAEYARERPFTKIFPVQARNAAGAGVINDDLIGDPSRRHRHFQFCLRKPPVALCAWGTTMRLADPKRDRLPYALKVIRSLEFLEPGSAPAPESPAPGPANRKPP